MVKNLISTKVKFTSRMSQFSESEAKRLDIAVLSMATDIHRQAIILAPKDSRKLVNSGKIVKEGLAKYVVEFGGGAVRYARRRHYENQKNPQTLRYLERAGKNVTKNLGKYIKKI